MPTNEAEVPPQRIWIDAQVAEMLVLDDQSHTGLIEYVPASALEDFRRRAIEAVRALFHNSEVNNSRWNLAIVEAVKAVESTSIEADNES